MIYDNILEAMGHTPMIRLNRMNKPGNAQILVKFEGLNVGGSVKTRTAYNMIKNAEKEGLINKDTVIVEPTSGNQGIGLALVGAVRGYKTVIIMPDSVSEERRKLVTHYGAEVILIHDDVYRNALTQPLKWRRPTRTSTCPSSLRISTTSTPINTTPPLRYWSRPPAR